MTELIKQGVLFVVARQEIDYKCPAVYGDILEVKTTVSDMSAVRINFENEIKNQNGALISRAKTVLVCVDSHLKPTAIPEDMRQKIAAHKK
jgi:acyl-CoA thioester hydrolase